MGSNGKRKAIRDLIETGEMEFDEGLETPGEPVETGPLDVGMLAEIREQRRKLQADPDNELPLYRDYYKQPDLTFEQADGILGQFEKAVADPDAYHDEAEQEGILDKVKSGASCAIKIPRWFIMKPKMDDAEMAAVAKLTADFKLGPDVKVDVAVHKFELCDPGWWRWMKAHFVGMKKWPEGLAPFLQHGGANGTFVYADTRATKKIALMSDFGVGQYHSRAIAAQLAHQKYGHVFHLGDVYYGGTQKEFDANYTRVLEPVMQHSLLWSLPENHELYTGGHAFQKFLTDHRGSGPGKVHQDGSYFAVRFANHQVVGIDANWNARQRYLKAELRDWLDDVLDVGEKNKLTTILLTGSGPWEYTSAKSSTLFEDLKRWTNEKRIAMWFWGNDHYCALFERDESKGSFVGSCIGHAGYPGGPMKTGEPSFVVPQFVETEKRFPPAYKLRDDLGNNGWCELAMLPDGGVELLYVDWLGCKRHQATYKVDVQANGGRLLELDGQPKRFTERTLAFP
ncbi:MAG: metallophosphoesterase family protein [Kofleriaceae bacterium]